MAIPAGEARERSGGGITVLVLDRAAIAAFNLPGGITWKWTERFVRTVERKARAKLTVGRGVRTGKLQRSIGHSVTPDGVNGVFGSVRATAKHALYYHEGTAGHGVGFIVAKTPLIRDSKGRHVSGGMFLPAYGIHRGRWEQAVHGQRGHPFLAEAMEETFDEKLRV